MTIATSARVHSRREAFSINAPTRSRTIQFPPSVMPKFYAGGTSIKLSAIKLQDTITEQPTVNKSIQSTLNVKQAEDAFSKSGVDGGFAENAIEDEETQSHMRFLGRSRDMPFFLVHAKERTFEDENSTHSHSDPRNDGIRPIKVSL